MSDPVINTPEAVPASPDAVLSGLSGDQRQHWRLTGELPSEKAPAAESAAPSSDTPSDGTRESSPAQPEGQAAEIAAHTPPASEPGTPTKANAATRIKELLAAKADLEARVAAFEARQSAPAPTAPDGNRVESSPTPQPRSLDTVIQQPDVNAPILTEEQFYNEFPEASVGAYVRYAARYEARAIEQESLQTQTRRQIRAKLAERAETIPAEVLPKIPAHLFNANPRELMGPNESPTVWNDVMTEALHSEQTGAIFAYLTEHPEAMTQLASCQNQAETIRVMAQIEARVSRASVPTQPAAKAVTSAPAPPQTLGRKPSPPANEADAAIAAGDFVRYAQAMNAREVAR